MSFHKNSGTAFDWYRPIHESADSPVVVLIHGLGLTRATWDGHIETLVKHYRVLTYDLAGHGESELPGQVPDLKLFAKQLFDLLSEVEVDHAALIGFSLGGMINRRFAIDFPSRVAALGILNSPHERSEKAQKLVEQRAVDAGKGGAEALLNATIERWFTPGFRAANPDILDIVKGWITANDPDYYVECRKVLANGVRELIRPHPPIRVPTIIITGENDSGSTPEMSLAIASEILGAKVLIIPHLQHMGLLEAPDLFTKPLCHFMEKVFCEKNH